MMVKSAPSLSVRSHLLYHKYILVIGVRLNIFALIAIIHFINESYEANLAHEKVIGLQNLDSESEEFRPFKKLIERLNRTYKFHIRCAYGFNSRNGAVALTTLFVTHYNFLRPHITLNYSVPIPL